ncbi:hypothetical protein [Nonomuraea insulae]|uniref:Uncharacterized protein n=1 Tax=Nonomuraea insulae TaxID=1616787 RepID=A0ABW1DDB2_9ACTN
MIELIRARGYVWAISYGISVQAAGGVSRAELHAMVDLTLQAWPPLPAADGTGPQDRPQNFTSG